jgi:hypothetical protein
MDDCQFAECASVAGHYSCDVEPTCANPKCASYNVRVDYDLRLDILLETGSYDSVGSGLEERNFPSGKHGTAKVRIQLHKFGGFMESEQILQAIATKDLRPATLHELVSLGAIYPELQHSFRIVALGSVWRDCTHGRRFVACLEGDSGKRILSLYDLDRGWGPVFDFAVVRE